MMENIMLVRVATEGQKTRKNIPAQRPLVSCKQGMISLIWLEVSSRTKTQSFVLVSFYALTFDLLYIFYLFPSVWCSYEFPKITSLLSHLHPFSCLIIFWKICMVSITNYLRKKLRNLDAKFQKEIILMKTKQMQVFLWRMWVGNFAYHTLQHNCIQLFKVLHLNHSFIFSGCVKCGWEWLNVDFVKEKNVCEDSINDFIIDMALAKQNLHHWFW